MRKVHLHGSLSKYASVLELDVETAGEAVRAICTNFPGATDDIAMGEWRLVRGTHAASGFDIAEEFITSFKLGAADLHIIPVIAGQKNGSAIKVVIGVALIAVSFGTSAFLSTAISSQLLGATTWGNAIGMIGLSMTASGISTMLSPQAKSSSSDNSYVISGPASTSQQGAAIPVVYGEVIVGGVIISGSLDIEGLKGPGETTPVIPVDNTGLGTGHDG